MAAQIALEMFFTGIETVAICRPRLRRRIGEFGRLAPDCILASGRADCHLCSVKVGYLYEQAVGLSARAARIAATLLAQEPLLPPQLRRALSVALLGAGEERIARLPGRRDEPDTVAATAFVEACRKVASQMPATDTPGDEPPEGGPPA